MIVDSHTHIFENGKGGPFNLPAKAEDLLESMDESKVDLSVVIPLPNIASNKFVFNECKRFPDRLVPIYTPDFSDKKNTINKANKFLNNNEVSGIKIHPRMQQIPASNSVVMEVLDLAETKQLPVIFDVFPFGVGFSEPFQQPSYYESIAQKKPDLKIILAHSGGYKVIEAFLVAKAYENIFLDISLTPTYFLGSSVEADLRFICGRLLPGKLLYGSDFPDVSIADSLKLAKRLTSEISKERQESLFSKAAIDIFKISV